jgi:hypothetical protein
MLDHAANIEVESVCKKYMPPHEESPRRMLRTWESRQGQAAAITPFVSMACQLATVGCEQTVAERNQKKVLTKCKESKSWLSAD